MKKLKILSVLLAMLLTVQAAVLPVSAEPEETTEESTAESTVESASTQTTEETIIYTSPANITGDASVNLGCHSINAAVPLTAVADYTPDAKAALLYDIDTETLLFGYNIDEKLYPASMTKVMTCLLALELGNLDDVIKVQYPMLEGFDLSSSAAGLQYGEEMTLENLLYCLMVASANDAAIVIADYLCGSEAAFVEKMNEKAAELGCTNTHFVNVHGLHDDEHYTTARDMAKIMLAALEYEKFNELYSTVTYEVPATSIRDARTLRTTNYLLMGSIMADYNDPRVIGGKTGHTTPAGRCLTTVSESGGMHLLSVMMAAGSTSGSTSAYISFAETSKLLNFGYNNHMATQILSEDMVLSQFDVINGETSVQSMVSSGAYTILPDGTDMGSIRYEYELDNGSISAPVAQGQALGVVRVWYKATCLAQQEIYAVTSVAKKAEPTTSGDQKGNSASPIGENSDIWHIVLVVILVLLGIIVLMMAAGYIRAAMLRAKRRKRREAMRRKKAAQARARSNSQRRSR